MSDGRAERDEAMQRAYDHADAEWKLTAYEAITHLAGAVSEFTTDDVWELLSRWEEPTTHEPRALGAIMRAAARDGYIERTNQTRDSSRAVCHRNPKRVWRSTVIEGVA